MPRLENKKHELYCYALVYHDMPRIRAVEFAGYAPFAMSYKRLEEREDVQERILEMRATPKDEIYSDVEEEEIGTDAVDADLEEISESEPKLKGRVPSTLRWVRAELRKNIEQARAEGNLKVSNEALKILAGVILEERKEQVAEAKLKLIHHPGKSINVDSAYTPQIPQEHRVTSGMGGTSRDSAEEADETAIPSPGDI